LCPTCILDPETTNEATFEENSAINASRFDFTALSPVTPIEADFYETIDTHTYNFTILALVIPS